MAVRLHLKLGLVPAADRLATSPDTVLVERPAVGSVIRSKGDLYAVVTARGGPGGRPEDATRLVAEVIRRQYYYDESAGIPNCLEKAIRSANQRLRHGREGHGLDRGSIGAVVAVVRGHELYVATIGDADAYLVRQARLLTLPEEERGEGLPNPQEAHVDVWRGEVVVGDTLVLAARDVTSKIGTEELKTAVMTLHPQSAAEHLHHLFVAAGGDGSDALLVVEASEVAATRAEHRLVPVRAAEPLAGAPERSPIPLADPVVEAASAVQVTARTIGRALGRGLAGLVDRTLELLPRRAAPYRRVVPLASRQESRRRAATAVLALLGVVLVLGVGAWLLGGVFAGHDRQVTEVNTGAQALQDARDKLTQVFGTGDLVRADPQRAQQLLVLAWQDLKTAAVHGVAASTLAPLQSQVAGGLDRLYAVRTTASAALVSLTAISPAANLVDLVRGPDGAAYVVDQTTASVVRIDLAAQTAKVVVKKGQGGGTGIGEPWLVATGGPDVLVLDRDGQLWRWRPSDAKGNGTLARLRLGGTTALGNDVVDIAAYVRNADSGLYFFYAIDPSSKQVLRYSPAADGSGFPAPSDYLAAAVDVSSFRAMAIDGDVYVLTANGVEKFQNGTAAGFSLDTPPDDKDLRPGHDYRLFALTGARGTGRIWAWDAAHARILAFNKADGGYLEQFTVESASPPYSSLSGMMVVERASGQAPVLIWTTAGGIYVSALEPAPEPAASFSPRPTGSASGSPGASPKASAQASTIPQP